MVGVETATFAVPSPVCLTVIYLHFKKTDRGFSVFLLDPSTDKKAKSVVLRLLSLSPVIFSALCLGTLASIAVNGHEAQIGNAIVQRILVDVVDVHTVR